MTLPPERETDLDFAAMIEAYKSETPLGRSGRPEDVARAVRISAGPESGWVTGQMFSADGGIDQGKGPDSMYGKAAMDLIRLGKVPF